MTKDQAIEALKTIKANNGLDKSPNYEVADDIPDFEVAHKEADKLLCELLTALGYEDVVTEYNTIGKWYA